MINHTARGDIMSKFTLRPDGRKKSINESLATYATDCLIEYMQHHFDAEIIITDETYVLAMVVRGHIYFPPKFDTHIEQHPIPIMSQFEVMVHSGATLSTASKKQLTITIYCKHPGGDIELSECVTLDMDRIDLRDGCYGKNIVRHKVYKILSNIIYKQFLEEKLPEANSKFSTLLHANEPRVCI